METKPPTLDYAPPTPPNRWWLLALAILAIMLVVLAFIMSMLNRA